MGQASGCCSLAPTAVLLVAESRLSLLYEFPCLSWLGISRKPETSDYVPKYKTWLHERPVSIMSCQKSMAFRSYSPNRRKKDRSKPISKDIWNEHRELIRDRYITQNKTREEVMSELEKLGFSPS